MRYLKDSKGFYMLLSVVIATIFWMFVRQTVDPPQTQTIRNIPVNLVGVNVLEDQALTIKSVSEDYVSMKVTAPLSEIERLRANNGTTANLDVSKLAAPGEYSLNYTFSYPSNVSYSDVELEERTPNKITVVVDKLNSSTFTIEPRLEGSIADGYQAGKWSISQDSVVISGAADQVKQVAKVVAVLTGEELSERMSADVPLTLLDKDGNELVDLEVKLSIDTVYVTLPVVVVRTIPLTVNYISGGGVKAENTEDYTPILFPETITVSGEEESIAELTEISLGSIDLSKVIGTNSFVFPIALDSRLENVSGISQAMVTVSVNNLATKTFEVENIDLINIPDGRKAEVVTQVRTVVVRGHLEDLELLDQSQMRIVADLSNETVRGSCTVPVEVYLNASDSVGVIGDYTIVVHIS